MNSTAREVAGGLDEVLCHITLLEYRTAEILLLNQPFKHKSFQTKKPEEFTVLREKYTEKWHKYFQTNINTLLIMVHI